MKWGHSSPSSKDSTVPDTAPTANRIAVPLAQRLASSRSTGSRGRQPAPLGDHHEQRHGDAHDREDDVEGERHAPSGSGRRGGRTWVGNLQQARGEGRRARFARAGSLRSCGGRLRRPAGTTRCSRTLAQRAPAGAKRPRRPPQAAPAALCVSSLANTQSRTNASSPQSQSPSFPPSRPALRCRNPGSP